MTARAAAALFATILALAFLPASADEAVVRQRVSFSHDGLTLTGLLYVPQGAGPFPAIVWNHGSEKSPGEGRMIDSVAAVFAPAGYIVFAPIRRGQGYSEGRYIGDALDQIRRTEGREAADRALVRLMESEQLGDQLAGLAYLKSLHIADPARIAVAGCSYGGIQTLLAVDIDHSYRAALALSPAALSWQGNPPLRARLLEAVARIDVPVLLLQPAQDASLEPARVLGAEAERLHKDFTAQIYPSAGPFEEQQHCFGGGRGTHVWAADALAFLNRVLHR